jgi:hypothetical protein
MPSIRKTIRTVGVMSIISTGVFALTGIATPMAKAEPCGPLVSQLRTTLNINPAVKLYFHWAQNYNANGHWTVNFGNGQLGKGASFVLNNVFYTPALSGYAILESSETSFDRPETVLVDILKDGRFITHRRYGPTPWSAVCYSGKFLTLDYWDGFDSFSFKFAS